MRLRFVVAAAGVICVMSGLRAEVDSGGALHHSIPIALPAAPGGVQPHIALSYNSHGGNGLVGVGWQIDGFPLITRMTYGAGINYSAGDTFTGPGGRLINFNATHTYRTEDENWSKYVPLKADGSAWTGSGGCGSGPCQWKVTGPDGDVLEFGATSDSRIEAVGRGGAVRVWALSKVTDAHGNFYTVAYSEDTANGDYYPTSVTYNQGNGRSTFYKVELFYDARTDAAPEYSQSALVVDNGRLKSIAVRKGGQLIRQYELGYQHGPLTGHSRLIEVKEYGRDGQSSLPAQAFRWQEGQSAWSDTAGVSGWGPHAGFLNASKYPTLSGDWNGDGKTDIGRVHDDGIAFLASTGSAWVQYPAGPAWGPNRGFTDSGKYPLFTGDWNGDGRTDIARVYNDGIGIAVSTASGWLETNGIPGWGINTGFTDGNAFPLLIGDWNGDGRTDIGRVHNHGIAFKISTSRGWDDYAAGPAWGPNAGFTNASRYPILIGDWNGDGRTDFGRVHNGGIAFAISTVSGGWQEITGVAGWGPDAGFTDGNVYPLLIGDWNGDGKTDFGRVHNSGISFQVSTGAGWQSFAAGPAWGLTTGFANGDKHPIFTGDWNGDGKSDIARVHNGGVLFSTSIGTGWQEFAAYAHWGPNEGYLDGNVYPILGGDWTGEGKSGLGRVHNDGIAFITRAGAIPDLLVGIDNGFGGTTTTTHVPAPLVSGAVRADLRTCTRQSSGPHPYACGNANPAALSLVTRMTVSDGRGSTYSTRYEYYNSRYIPGVPSDAENLGFTWTKVIDEQLGTWQQTVYQQERPYHGRAYEQAQYAPNGSLLNRTRYKYTTVSSANATRLVRTQEEEQEQYEFGTLKYGTKVIYAYDAYGNPALTSNLNDVSTATDDLYRSISYINDTNRWRIGLPQTTRTCADAACSVVLQQTANYYDGLSLGQVGARGNLSKAAQWRSDGGRYLDTSYTYDATGNVFTRTDAAGIVSERNEYDAASGALIRTTDALGHTVARGYDTLSGQLAELTDANSNTSSYFYDVFGRRVRTETPHQGSIKAVIEEAITYNPYQKTVTVHTDDDTISTITHLDGLERVWKTTQTWDSGALLQSDAHFDSAGREDKACAPHVSTLPEDAASCSTTYFDPAGRLARVESPRSGGGFATATIAYDGYRTTKTDTAGHVTVSDYEPATLTSVLTQPGGLVTRTRKDTLGRVVRVTDPAGNAATYAYNSLGWKVSSTDPVTGAATFGYDDLGRLVSRTDAAGQTVNMHYDVAGRLLRTDYAPLSASSAGAEDTVMKYDYLASAGDIANGKGKVVRIQDRAGITVLGYDMAGRVRTATKTVDGIEYASTTTFDRSGKRTSVTYPDGSVVAYDYGTDAGHLSAITLDGVEVMRYANYNERGSPTSLAYGGSVDTLSLTFEGSTGELLQQQDSRDFANNYYAYDERGMLIEERDLRSAKPNGDTSKAFAYDPLGQLTAAAMGADAACNSTSCSGSAWSKRYRYDETGRVLEKDGKTFSYDVAKRFQLTRITGETADRTYDPVGRLQSKVGASGAETYVNGADGFLHEHRRGGTTLHRMTYDYLGNRVKKAYVGTNPQTTWDLGTYKIVHDQSSGKYYHTLYVMGLHGSRIAHRTVEKPGLVAAAALAIHHDRALASLYEPKSLGGLLPWAEHRGAAMVKALLRDIDGARGTLAALAGFAMLVAILVLSIMSLLQLASLVMTRLQPRARPKRRAAWLAPAMLCAASAACVGNYDTDPQEQASADSIAKDGRYRILQALRRGGTSEPVPGTFYYMNSPLGSTSVMFDAQGSALLRLEYFPDGTVNSAASQGDYIATHTYGQKEYDKELEAYYNAFRYYDAETMRFTTPDAIKESDDYLVHNIYAYTRNNPVNYTDPTGFRTMQHDGGGGGYQQSTYVPPPHVPALKAPRPVERVRTNPAYNRGPDGVTKITTPPPAPKTVRASANPPGVSFAGPPGKLVRFPLPREANMPDGIRDADAPFERRDPTLRTVYYTLIDRYGTSDMTLGYHGYQIEHSETAAAAVNAMEDWGIPVGYYLNPWSFPRNMDLYRDKVNVLFTTEDGIRLKGTAPDGSSITLREALVARVNYPIGPGARATHEEILRHGGTSICAPILCAQPTTSRPWSPPDSSAGGGGPGFNPKPLIKGGVSTHGGGGAPR